MSVRKFTAQELDVLASTVLNRRPAGDIGAHRFTPHRENILGLLTRGLKPYQVARLLRKERPRVDNCTGSAIRRWLFQIDHTRDGRPMDDEQLAEKRRKQTAAKTPIAQPMSPMETPKRTKPKSGETPDGRMMMSQGGAR